MADFEDPVAAANRLRGATDGLTDLRDWDIVRQYLRELEARAAKPPPAPDLKGWTG